MWTKSRLAGSDSKPCAISDREYKESSNVESVGKAARNHDGATYSIQKKLCLIRIKLERVLSRYRKASRKTELKGGKRRETKWRNETEESDPSSEVYTDDPMECEDY